MNAFKTTLLACCIALSAGTAMAQDAMKKEAPMMKKEMTMQECKDHMAMAKNDGMKKDDAMMKKDTACAEMMDKGAMGKDGMGKDGMMKDGGASAPMKK